MCFDNADMVTLYVTVLELVNMHFQSRLRGLQRLGSWIWLDGVKDRSSRGLNAIIISTPKASTMEIHSWEDT